MNKRIKKKQNTKTIDLKDRTHIKIIPSDLEISEEIQEQEIEEMFAKINKSLSNYDDYIEDMKVDIINNRSSLCNDVDFDELYDRYGI